MLYVHLIPVALEEGLDVQFAPDRFLADTGALWNVRDPHCKVLLTVLIGHDQIVLGENRSHQAFLFISEDLALTLDHRGASASSRGTLLLLGQGDNWRICRDWGSAELLPPGCAANFSMPKIVHS